MKTLEEIRTEAAEHATQLAATRYLSVQDLAARWNVDERLVREIPRAQLPYLPFGASRMRRYAPKDVEQYEADGKTGLHDPPTNEAKSA